MTFSGTYYVIDSRNASLEEVDYRMGGYVTYETFEEANGILDVRDNEAVYKISIMTSKTDNTYLTSTAIERMNP